MNEKKTFGEEVKEWWHDNKKVVKAGVVCGLAGLAYGFIKGMNSMNELWFKHGFEPAKADPVEPYPYDDLESSDDCDDPELIELINLETENT